MDHMILRNILRPRIRDLQIRLIKRTNNEAVSNEQWRQQRRPLRLGRRLEGRGGGGGQGGRRPTLPHVPGEGIGKKPILAVFSCRGTTTYYGTTNLPSITIARSPR
jgi:hypothetical protein